MKVTKERILWAAIGALTSAILIGGLFSLANIYVNFKEWNYIYGLFALPLLFGVLILFRSQEINFYFLNTSLRKEDPSGKQMWRELVIYIPYLTIITGLSFLLMALARPQFNEKSWSEQETEGIEIMLTLDISNSMLAEDLKPNRLEASKKIAKEFILDRPYDKIGISLYAGAAFLQCPSTTDHATLLESFGSIVPNRVTGGTAIGAGLAQALSSLKDSETKSKIVILLTDGINNVPASITPMNGAEIAKKLGIRIYTIGVGSKGKAPFPMYYMGRKITQMQDVEIDEVLLTKMAQTTGGKYFRATDNKSLKQVYQEIDQLEKQFMRVTQYSKAPEANTPFLWAAFLSLILAFIFFKLLTPNFI